MNHEAVNSIVAGLRQAEETGSLKYVGWFHLAQGELALRTGQPAAAVTELGRALEVARRIGFPTLTWQSAQRLAEAQAAGGCLTDAASAAILTAETIERLAAEAPTSGAVRRCSRGLACKPPTRPWSGCAAWRDPGAPP